MRRTMGFTRKGAQTLKFWGGAATDGEPANPTPPPCPPRHIRPFRGQSVHALRSCTKRQGRLRVHHVHCRGYFRPTSASHAPHRNQGVRTKAQCSTVQSLATAIAMGNGTDAGAHHCDRFATPARERQKTPNQGAAATCSPSLWDGSHSHELAPETDGCEFHNCRVAAFPARLAASAIDPVASW